MNTDEHRFFPICVLCVNLRPLFKEIRTWHNKI